MSSPPPGGPAWTQGPDGQWYPVKVPHGPPLPGHPVGPSSPNGKSSYGDPSHGAAAGQYGGSPPGAPGGQYGWPPPYGAPGQYGPSPPYGTPHYGPPPPPGPPWGAPSQFAPPPSPPARGRGGKIALIVLGVIVAVVLIGGFVVYRFISGVIGNVGGLAEGGGDCTVVAKSDVEAALGGSYDVIALGGIGQIAAPVLDARVLADAPTCWAVESGDSDTGGRLARIAVYSGSDAAQRFATEQTAAMGTTEDRGNGLSVSSEAYFNKVVQAGDEAFCTRGDFLGSAGVLVRRGNELIYVSTTAAGAGAGTPPDIGIAPGTGSGTGGIAFATDDKNCDLAVALAAKVK